MFCHVKSISWKIIDVILGYYLVCLWRWIEFILNCGWQEENRKLVFNHEFAFNSSGREFSMEICWVISIKKLIWNWRGILIVVLSSSLKDVREFLVFSTSKFLRFCWRESNKLPQNLKPKGQSFKIKFISDPYDNLEKVFWWNIFPLNTMPPKNTKKKKWNRKILQFSFSIEIILSSN